MNKRPTYTGNLWSHVALVRGHHPTDWLAVWRAWEAARRTGWTLPCLRAHLLRLRGSAAATLAVRPWVAAVARDWVLDRAGGVPVSDVWATLPQDRPLGPMLAASLATLGYRVRWDSAQGRSFVALRPAQQ